MECCWSQPARSSASALRRGSGESSLFFSTGCQRFTFRLSLGRSSCSWPSAPPRVSSRQTAPFVSTGSAHYTRSEAALRSRLLSPAKVIQGKGGSRATHLWRLPAAEGVVLARTRPRPDVAGSRCATLNREPDDRRCRAHTALELCTGRTRVLRRA